MSSHNYYLGHFLQIKIQKLTLQKIQLNFRKQ